MKTIKIKLFNIEVSDGFTTSYFLVLATSFNHAEKIADEIIHTQGYGNCEIRSISHSNEAYMEVIE